ncbi:MAG: hypothetical protein A3J30_04230 [Candidatus Wildermuthbacteria bacterium RIFCSPLOWO2_02_FULL_47_9c]|uniref:Metalloprotease TldD/E C-terminal domain-containing protein n=2 Tax=Parcubacteria group TaxID=1794811 RepID=A0A837IP29_9BACT|nr:MAG: hypothetical protein UY25_C0002G0081 [Candidatus Yanofskybacteria bacterium GW2011_GWC1_48_11]KKW04671.1 MAG: hypothetical protein UY38_C0001G0238 [Parcubacteria group bacterium GW2011_GWB1_49_12]KKW09029.1 MAG: hypothetical protein UY45_C0002G0081 [Parcubacteria group bacterium GW2011_GWA1_49_26]OHA61079.1 MAG: hypothetical protein A2109_02395 [Candidatus Wildermuthbacteria bacterium GWA1_49_26]OHA66326.1 MAG: hypothetical protein A2674_02675 [Candidatus Wildermuthbacteria bacterium RI
MIRPTETQETAQRLLSLARKEGAEFAEVMAMQNEFSLKRIRQNQVDQPPAGEQWSIDLALVKGKRRKTVCLDNPLGVEKIIRETMERIDLLPEHEPHVPTEKFASVGQPLSLYDKKTAELSGDRLVALAQEATRQLAHHNLFLSGKILQGRGEVSYVNTVGTRQNARFTQASAAFFAFGADDLFISAYENSGGISIDHIEIERMVGKLAEKCELQRGKKKIDLFSEKDGGEEIKMDVILEPYFFSTLFGWLGFFGFNGLFVEHGESFISDKVGQQVMGENITIADDPADNRNKGMGFPFDFEGRPRKKIVLVEQGIAKRALYDSALAAEWGKEATCNALPPSSRSEGAAPFDLVIEGGNTSVEEMIKHSKEPTLWITKLHYPGMKHYQTATMTGVAQHGVFLVENGKVVSPVENVRFEENIPEALKRVEALSESRLVFDPLSPSLPSGVVAPAMKIKQFRFVGSTQRSI